MRPFRESLWLVLMDSSSNAFQKQPPTGVLSKSCSENYAANLQDNTHAEVWFQYSCKATLLKSYFGMDVL